MKKEELKGKKGKTSIKTTNLSEMLASLH